MTDDKPTAENESIPHSVDPEAPGNADRWRVVCDECGEIEADTTTDGQFSRPTAERRAGFHEGAFDHIVDVQEVTDDEIRRGDVAFFERSLEWPRFYISGEDKIDVEDWAPAFWKLEGPIGPVMFRNQHTDPRFVTMFEFAVEPTLNSFAQVDRVETPWGDTDD